MRGSGEVAVNLKTALLAVTAAAALLGAAIIGVPSTLRQGERPGAHERARPSSRDELTMAVTPL